MPTARDSQGRWWDLVVQAAGTMDCGFAYTAMVGRYYFDDKAQTQFVSPRTRSPPIAGRRR